MKVLTKIENIFGDTIFIVQSAGIGDVWIFVENEECQYQAEIIAHDTMTFDYIFDSVKVIRISRMDAEGMEDESDPLNGLEMILSKENGLLQGFELYYFPNFSFQVEEEGGWEDVDFYIFRYLNYSMELNRDLLTFKRVFFHKYKYEYFDFNEGDYFITLQHRGSGLSGLSLETFKDTINGIVENEEWIAYTKNRLLKEDHAVFEYDSVRKWTTYEHYTYHDTLFKNTLMIAHLPEEKNSEEIIFYYPEDSSFCVQSPEIYISKLYQFADDGNFYPYSYSSSFSSYKIHLGKTSGYSCYQAFDEFSDVSNYLAYASTAGVECRDDNDPTPLGITETDRNSFTFKVYPNPSDGVIYIQADPQEEIRFCIYDQLGRVVYQEHHYHPGNVVTLPSLPSGLYILQVTNRDQSGIVKFVISR
ncbi:MAG: T9SS type A sorting domain-containing protein [Taibaiella sp.]|nr:T9SS type A sorting domain-containing protein [Taibaiella sp.]